MSSLTQFARSMSTIRRAEHISRPESLLRHLYFQGRKLLFPRPLTLRLSRSLITDDEAGGVISMVNMLGLYDYNNMSLVQTALRGGGVMLDVGANIGPYTLIASEDASVRVVALEPNPRAFAKLQRNLSLNGRGNVVALPLAASAAPGRLQMTDCPQSVLNHIVAEPGGADATISVEVTTLDTLCAERALRPSVLKLDVEGHEAEVLAGAASCLTNVDVVLVENGERPQVVRILRDHGLRGPYYYHHRSQAMQLARQRMPEDSVFIGRRFERRLPDIAVPAAS